MESHRSLLVTGAGNYEFKYHLDPQSFTSLHAITVPFVTIVFTI